MQIDATSTSATLLAHAILVCLAASQTPTFQQTPIGPGCGGAMGSLTANLPMGQGTGWLMHDPWVAFAGSTGALYLQVGFVSFSQQVLAPPLDIGVPFLLPTPCWLQVAPVWVFDWPYWAPGSFWGPLPPIPLGLSPLYVQGAMAAVGFNGSFYISVTPAFQIL